MSKRNQAVQLVAKPLLALAWVLAMSAGLAIGVPAQHSAEHEAESGAHRDHQPKHGGVFFMAMNYHHHLEGVLEAPGTFRVYVYDDHSMPLVKEKAKEVSGKLFLGDSDEAPEIPLKLSRDGMTVEATLPAGTKLPVTLTLLMRFPGMKADARPELFTFLFDAYSKAEHHSSSSRGPSMEGM